MIFNRKCNLLLLQISVSFTYIYICQGLQAFIVFMYHNIIFRGEAVFVCKIALQLTIY